MRSFMPAKLLTVALLILAACVVGCGDGTKATTAAAPSGTNAADFKAQHARALDAQAKSDVRNMVTQVEVCAVDYSGDYSHCANLRNTGLAIGSAPGQVEVKAAGGTYTVTGYSRSGNKFTVAKD